MIFAMTWWQWLLAVMGYGLGCGITYIMAEKLDGNGEDPVWFLAIAVWPIGLPFCAAVLVWRDHERAMKGDDDGG